MTVESALLGAGLLLLLGILGYFALSVVRQLRGSVPANPPVEMPSDSSDRMTREYRVDQNAYHPPGRSTPRTTLVFELLFVGLVVALLVVGIIEFVGRLG